MRIKALLPLLLLTIIATISNTGWAGSGPKKPRPANTITDAAGRTHVRPTARISDAQRKAAAQYRKAMRAKGSPARKPQTGKVR